MICPHCSEPLTRSQVASMLASLNKGVSKNLTPKQHAEYSERARQAWAKRKSLVKQETV